MHTIEYPIWVWAVFFAVVITALIVDIGIVNRKAHAPTRKETIGWSIVWVSLALIFNGFVYWVVGRQFNDWTLALAQAKLFLTGYLIELSLSVDNLFVFLLIFTFFKVPKKYQHRVLFWGIMGALGLRMIMIFAGAELVAEKTWRLSTLLRGLGWLDGSLHGDVAVRGALQALLDVPERIDEKRARTWLEPFSPWRALVAAHLWASRTAVAY